MPADLTFGMLVSSSYFSVFSENFMVFENLLKNFGESQFRSRHVRDTKKGFKTADTCFFFYMCCFEI